MSVFLMSFPSTGDSYFPIHGPLADDNDHEPERIITPSSLEGLWFVLLHPASRVDSR
jgi:hypothetical protein